MSWDRHAGSSALATIFAPDAYAAGAATASSISANRRALSSLTGSSQFPLDVDSDASCEPWPRPGSERDLVYRTLRRGTHREGAGTMDGMADATISAPRLHIALVAAQRRPALAWQYTVAAGVHSERFGGSSSIQRRDGVRAASQSWRLG